MTVIKAFLLSLLVTCSVHNIHNEVAAVASTTKPKYLSLHIDVNKTIIAIDKSQNRGLDETVNEILAQFTRQRWDKVHEQSYQEYVSDLVAKAHPALARNSERFKNIRHALIQAFPKYLQLYPEWLATYELEKKQLFSVLEKPSVAIFPSFFKLIDWLEENYTNRYSIYLRTFGQDLPHVVPVIEKSTGLRFSGCGEIKDRVVSMGSEKKSIFSFFSNCDCKHYALRDNYEQWKNSGFSAAGGKPYPIDLENPDVITIFFDDNADDVDSPILCPLTSDAVMGDTKELMKKGRIVAVNSKEAALDSSYFIRAVASVIAGADEDIKAAMMSLLTA